MLKRFKITKDCAYGNLGRFVVLDRLKLATTIPDKRLTSRFFNTREEAQGFLVGHTGRKEYANA